jgi:RNA polymerase sigma-70 factor (ECF subfamily)
VQALIDWTEFLTAAAPLRPMLHKYCARLLGSVTDAEDLVHDTLIKAFTAPSTPTDPQLLRPWLFKIAHNRAIDLLRAQAIKNNHALQENDAVAEREQQARFASADNDPLQHLIQQETLAISLGAFVHLPIAQRSVVILKDVLGEPLADIASLLGLTIDAVKGHLARGRRGLSLHRTAISQHSTSAFSAQLVQYVDLFNQRDWPALKQLLSHEVILKQSSHPQRRGAADVGTFFTIYAGSDFGHLKAAWLDGREVILVYPPQSAVPKYLMWLQWQHHEICFIRDYRYVDYLLAELPLIDLAASI